MTFLVADSTVVSIAVSGLFMAGLGLLLAAVLAVASKKLHVYEDPRVEEVDELLPHANCGACGMAGCRIFAEKVVSGQIEPSRCTVNPPEMNQIIANLLGVELGQHERSVARLACAGGDHVAYLRASYQGMRSCRAAALVGGGGKACPWGCLGLGDCETVCDFDAITLDRHGLPVVDVARCTGCGDCVEVCPKDLFSLHPLSHRLWVACRNEDPGDDAEALCEVACTGCGRCAMDAPEGVVEIRRDLAVIDYGKNALASPIAIERCPTGAIVWFDDGRGARKGRDARKIVRKEALPVA